jgi:hypothetical protein
VHSCAVGYAIDRVRDHRDRRRTFHFSLLSSLSRIARETPRIISGSMFNVVNFCFGGAQTNDAIAARATGGPVGKDP